jgi:hypothetical protein
MPDVARRLLWALAWIVILAVAVGTVLLGLIMLLGAIPESRLQRQIAAIRAAGDPTSLADLPKRSIPPDEDAGELLHRARKGLLAIVEALDEVRQSETYQQGRPTEAEMTAIQAALEAHAEALSLVEQAAACDDCVPRGDHEASRAAIRALEARIVMRLGQGRRDKALDDCIAMFRLARLLEKNPTVADYLVAFVCRGLAVENANLVLRSGPVSPDARQSLDAELARQEGVEGFQSMLKTARVVGLQKIRGRPAEGWLAKARRSQEASAYLEQFEELLSQASGTYTEFQRAETALSLSPATRGWLRTMVAYREGMERTRAQVRCLRVLSALQRADEEGEPDGPDLADLGLPRDAILDPFTGDRLRVKKLPEGWLIYSLGSNMKDDDGRIDPFLDVGVVPLPRLGQATETQETD